VYAAARSFPNTRLLCRGRRVDVALSAIYKDQLPQRPAGAVRAPLAVIMSKLDFNVSRREIDSYFTTLAGLLTETAVTSGSGAVLETSDAVSQVMAQARSAHAAGSKLIFVGNGGSAAIASHMATDYSKNGDIRSLALNDSSMLTCLGNDLGYDRIFAKQIELHARPGDLVIAISSSGRSANILNAVSSARAAKCAVVTLSGFAPDNPLRRLGDINFYIASDRYGFVEIGHLTICHAILDFICGLRLPDGRLPATAA
jgi:D-sedoheptulose 7-phosphate isomerase